MNPFELLGVAPGSDAATIKRAYARRLREVRPEDDPEGFQRLHEAYQRVLQLCREPDAVAAAPVAANAATYAAPVPPVQVAPPAAAAFHFDAFYEQVVALAAAGDATRLTQALHDHPALWSLQMKSLAGGRLLAQLLRDTPSMPRTCLDALLAFFDLDQVRSRVDPIALERYARRSQLAWEMAPEHRDALARRLGMTAPRARRLLDANLRRLTRPFSWWRGVVAGFVPYRGRHMAAFIRTLSADRPEELPASVSREQLRFWVGSDVRSPLNVNQVLFFTGVLLIVSAILSVGGLAYAFSRSGHGDFSIVFFELGLVWGSALVFCAVLFGWRGWRQLERWQYADESYPTRWPRLRLAAIPLLWCAGVIAIATVPWKAFGVLWILPALWLSLRRYWRRHDGRGWQIRPGPTQIGLIAAAMITPVQPAWVFAAAALVAWLDDWRRNVLASVNDDAA